MAWQPLVLLVLLALTALYYAGRALKDCARYWSAPWRNDRHRYLSLARLLVTALVVVTCYAAVAQPQHFWPHGGAALIGFLIFVMWLDIATSKLSNEALPIVSGGVKLPGLSRLASLIPGGAAATDPEPEAPVVPGGMPEGDQDG